MEVKQLSLIRMLLDNAEYAKSIRLTDNGKIIRVDFLYSDECDTITWKFKKDQFDKIFKKYLPAEKIIK